MNELDETTFTQFAARFGRIERLVPEPPPLGADSFARVRHRRTTVVAPVLLGAVLLLAAILGLAVVGSQHEHRPVTIPPASAEPEVVLDAYLAALEAGDCTTASQLVDLGAFQPGRDDLCGVRQVLSYDITGGPTTIGNDTDLGPGSRVGFTTLLEVAPTDRLPGETGPWYYVLHDQGGGGWKIVEAGSGALRPSAAASPSAAPSPTAGPSASAAVSWGPLAIIPPQGGTDRARMEGSMRITGACVYVDRGGEETFLFWPADRTTWDEASRAITFTNYDGTIVTVRNGDSVVLGGGGDSEAESGVSGEEWAATMTWVVSPAGPCSLDSRFGVGGVATPAPTPTATASPSAEPEATPQPTIPPFPRTPTLGGHASSLEAGCRAVHYQSGLYTSDQCGPMSFDEVRRATPIVFSPGEQVTIVAPAHYAFSAIDAGLADGWSVTIASASDLKGLEVGFDGIPKEVGRVLASGVGPDRKVPVTLPAESGTYVVQLAAPLARDGWTFAGGLSYWLVRVP